jgi:hypothetical protein
LNETEKKRIEGPKIGHIEPNRIKQSLTKHPFLKGDEERMKKKPISRIGDCDSGNWGAKPQEGYNGKWFGWIRM